MDDEVIVAKLPLSLDLRPLSGCLEVENIPHRIYESSGWQVIAASEQYLNVIQGLLIAWGEGKEAGCLLQTPSSLGQGQGKSPIDAPPLTIIVLLCCAVGYLLASQILPLSWLFNFSFERFIVEGEQVLSGSAQLPWHTQQWWRLLSPIFLHFEILHLVFSGLWFWEFARRVERGLGAWVLLLVILLTGLSSNLAQSFATSHQLFGGMSGVDYGLLGFIFIHHKLSPLPLFNLPKGIIGIMIFFLILGFTGVMDVFVGGSIANTAHLVGFIAGCVGGIVSGLLARRV